MVQCFLIAGWFSKLREGSCLPSLVSKLSLAQEAVRIWRADIYSSYKTINVADFAWSYIQKHGLI